MQAGDIVAIYQKPLTEEGYEGFAQLVKRRFQEGFFAGRRLVHWTVRFGILAEHPDGTQHFVPMEKRAYERAILYPFGTRDPEGE